jgi:hypothetical protein
LIDPQLNCSGSRPHVQNTCCTETYRTKTSSRSPFGIFNPHITSSADYHTQAKLEIPKPAAPQRMAKSPMRLSTNPAAAAAFHALSPPS